jgi:hypothetical protein
VDWIGLAQDRDKGQVESSRECGNEPLGSINCWDTIKWLYNWCIIHSILFTSSNLQCQLVLIIYCETIRVREAVKFCVCVGGGGCVRENVEDTTFLPVTRSVKLNTMKTHARVESKQKHKLCSKIKF